MKLETIPAWSYGKLTSLILRDGQRSRPTSELSRKYIEPAVKEIGDPLAPGWPSAEVLRQFDRVSMAELLRNRGASPEEIALLQVIYSDSWDNGTAPDSALCLLRDEAIARKGASFRIRGGNDQLPKALAQSLGARVHYRTTLERIQQNNKQVTVTVNTSGRRSQISADYLICAIPFTVLRSIEVSPAFSEGKQRAIRELTYNSVTRVYVQSPNPVLDRGWTLGLRRHRSPDRNGVGLHGRPARRARDPGMLHVGRARPALGIAFRTAARPHRGRESSKGVPRS